MGLFSKIGSVEKKMKNFPRHYVIIEEFCNIYLEVWTFMGVDGEKDEQWRKSNKMKIKKENHKRASRVAGLEIIL